MNFEHFIARRIISSKQEGFSSVIVAIAVAAITLSVVVMIITTSVIRGFKNEISGKVFDFWGHIHISDQHISRGDFEVIPMTKDSIFMNSISEIDAVSFQHPKDLEILGERAPVLTTKGGVRSVEPFIVIPGIISNQQSIEGLLMRGIFPEYDHSRLSKMIRSGRAPKLINNNISREVVMSTSVADRLNLMIDQQFIIHFMLGGEPIKRRVKLVGLYHTGLEEYDKRYILIDGRLLQNVLQWDDDQVSGVEVYVEYNDDMEVLNEYIYYKKLPPHLFSESIRTKYYEIFKWLELQNINERLIITLMVIVAIINMITCLLIFVLERTRMIGMLKTIGATNWSIRQIFLYHAFYIILRGLLLGNAIAFAFCLLQMKTGWLKLSEKEYYLDTVPIEFDWSMIAMVNIGSIILTLLFLIVPSLLVSRISPVRSVHYH